MLKIHTIQAYDDNYIWLIHQQGNKNCVVVDPGDEKPVLATLKHYQLDLEAILITHHHFDHTAGIKDLVSATGATVFGPASENISEVDYPMTESDRVNLAKSCMEFTVFDVPGHTIGHLAYLTEDKLFSGDCLFSGGCGRIFDGTAEQMFQSINKLAQLPDDTRIYCAHEYTEANLQFAMTVEPENTELIDRFQKVRRDRKTGKATVPSTMALEKATNPFMRCHLKSVIYAANSYINVQQQTETETFATIRQWKDRF